MKNISERENRVQFEGFHELVYDLGETELKGVQIIIIDKEYCPPSDDCNVALFVRHMKVDDPEYPPLISYYHGK